MSGKDSDKGQECQQERNKKKPYHKWQRRGQAEPKKKEKDREAIPILKYGPANNYMQFKETLANAALKEYGALGKMIKQGEEYTEPEEPDVEDYDLKNDPYGINKTKYIEDLKKYHKEMSKLNGNRPKLYGLITQYLSEESLDEIKRQDRWERIDEAADPKGLWKLVEEMHKVNTISKVVSVTKLSARTTYESLRQGGFESIIAYKDNAALKAYNDQKNPKMEDGDVAMDFCHGLDNARYASFKAEIIMDLLQVP